MTMGLSMALHERGMIDPWFGHVVNHNLADYLSPPAPTSARSMPTG
jgi:xanthine dehydrogenase YagR molybdenum-binding subunit